MASTSFSVFRDPRQREVHASTLLLYKNRLLSAWFGGSKEGNPDTKIWFSTRTVTKTTSASEDGNWEEPRIVAGDDVNSAHWNPVLFQLPGSETILLFYKVGSPISSWETFVQSSSDGGESWTKPRELVPGDKGGRGPVKNKPIAMEDGIIVAPASLETATGVWHCFVDLSSDGGLTWEKSSTVPINRETTPGEGAIQPSLISYGTGKLAMLTRSSAGYILRSDSEDGGKNWCEMYKASLPNNNSGLDAIRLESGIWLVVHNPVQQRWGPRTPLVVSSSSDEGRTWKQLASLEDKALPGGFQRIVAKDTGIENDGTSEFSYPSIIGDGEGGVFISYTYERVGIKHVHLQAHQI